METSTDTKIVIGVLIATVVIIIGAAFLASRQTDPSAPNIVDPEILVRTNSPIRGPEDAEVTIVEFGDFECPACAAVHPILQQVKANNEGRPVRFVYRHYPLPQHRHAETAARASYAAQQQGMFWEFHDILFENQSRLTDKDLEEHAQQLGLDMERFRQDMSSSEARDAVARDRNDARVARVSGTPTFFINNVQYIPSQGQYSVLGFQEEIDAILSGQTELEEELPEDITIEIEEEEMKEEEAEFAEESQEEPQN